MEIKVTKNRTPLPLTILHLSGRLDGSNYQDLIDEAQRQFDSGTRDLLLDLSGLTYLSSAGITALHSVALLFRGQKVNEREVGWAAFHAITRERGGAPQVHVKLLGLNERIRGILDLVGFTSFFEIFSTLNQAVASFR